MPKLKDRRRKFLMVRVNEAEKAVLDRVGRGKVSDWARKTLLKAAKRILLRASKK